MSRERSFMLTDNLLDRIESIEAARKFIEEIHRKKSGRQRYQYWLNVFGKSVITVQDHLKKDGNICIALLVMSRLAEYKIMFIPGKRKEKYSITFPETEYILDNWDFALNDPVIVVETNIASAAKGYKSVYDVLIDTENVPELIMRKGLGEDIADIEITEHITSPKINNQRFVRLYRGKGKEKRIRAWQKCS